MKKWMTTREVAKLAGVAPERVRQQVYAYRVSGGKTGLVRFSQERAGFHRDDVKAWLRKRAPIGHPRRHKLDGASQIISNVLHYVDGLGAMKIWNKICPIRIRWDCDLVLQNHQHSPRLFAHAFHWPNTICLHRDALKLPKDNLSGIVVHEIGHICSGDRGNLSAEPKADQWVRDNLGIEVLYSTKTTLEFLSHADMRKLGLE